MMYRDGMEIELGDRCDVYSVQFETEEATVTAIGKKKIQIEYVNEHIKPRREYIDPASCELIARAA